MQLHDVVRLAHLIQVLRRLANLASLVEDRPAPRYPARADALAAAEGPRGADEGDSQLVTGPPPASRPAVNCRQAHIAQAAELG